MLCRYPTKSISRSATAAVELALTLTFILVPLLLGMWEVGRLLQVQQIVENAAREGGRQASTAKYTNADCEDAVRNYLSMAGLSLTNVQITVKNNTGNGGEVYNAPAGHEVQVDVSYPYQNVRYVMSTFFVAEGTMLNAQAIWRSVRDFPVSIPTDPPSAPLPPTF